MQQNVTTYKEICDGALRDIKSYEFINMEEKLVYEVLIDYIRPAIVRYSNCKQDLSDRDDLLQQFNFVLTDANKEILIRYVVINWIEANFINVPSLLKTQLTSKEFNATRSVELLDKLIILRTNYLSEIDNLISKSSYKSSTLFDIR